MLSKLGSGIRNLFDSQFSKKEGKDFVKKSSDAPSDDKKAPLDTVKIKRIGTLAGAGGGAGLAAGAAAGLLMANRAIMAVPVQEKTVSYQAPVLQSEELGKMPRDSYTPTPGWRVGYSLRWNWPSSDSGVPTEGVHRDNPVYDANGQPSMMDTSKTFSGRGTPILTWETKEIKHHTMNGYNRAVIPDIEQVYDHTEYWTEQEAYTVYDTETESYQNCVTEYNSDGSTGQDCYTDYRTVSVPRTEYRTVERSRDVYRDELRGYYERYSPDISSRTVGTYQAPQVRFDHGVSVGSYLAKGVLIGAGLGALALGVAGALEDKYLPGVLPGYQEPRDDGRPDPAPNPGPGPKPPAPNPPRPAPPKPAPRPDYGKTTTHAHEGQRHTHAGGDRWHFHGCPDEGHDPINTDIICFKPDQVPSGYQDEAPYNCDVNGSVCYKQKG